MWLKPFNIEVSTGNGGAVEASFKFFLDKKTIPITVLLRFDLHNAGWEENAACLVFF